MRWLGLNSVTRNGPRADHVGAVARVVLQVLPVTVDVLGQDRAQRRAHGEHDGRVRHAHADDGGVGVGGVDLLDRPEHGLERVVGLDGHDRKRDVGRGHRLAVVEHGVLAQVQRQALAVVGELPAFGKVGLRVPLVVEAQRAGEDLCRGHRRRDARLHAAVQVPRHLRAAHYERAAAFGCVLCAGRQREGSACSGKQREGVATIQQGTQHLGNLQVTNRTSVIEGRNTVNEGNQQSICQSGSQLRAFDGARQGAQAFKVSRRAANTTCRESAARAGGTVRTPPIRRAPARWGRAAASRRSAA